MRIVIIISAILLYSCGGSDPSKTFSGNEFSGSGYSVHVPDDWQTKRNFMGSDMIASRPSVANEQFTENINVILENLPEKMSAQEYYNQSKENLEKMSGSPVTSEELVELNGSNALKIRYQLTMGQMVMDNNVYLVVNDASAYVITLSMRKGESRDKWLPELTRVAQTFQVE